MMKSFAERYKAFDFTSAERLLEEADTAITQLKDIAATAGLVARNKLPESQAAVRDRIIELADRAIHL
jgi:hypothetical protein